VIRFLLKGLIRDRSRSLFPSLIVATGAMLTVFLQTYVNGVFELMIRSTAHYSTGHVRIMTGAYAREADQVPNDLALMQVDSLLDGVRRQFPDILWAPRIKFGGLLDIPDEYGETRAQSPVFGTAVRLLSSESPEWNILDIQHSIVKGRMPERQGDILIADDLANRLAVRPGEIATLISSTMHGSMAVSNFTVAGTIRFGIAALDRGAVIADLADVQQALDMQDGTGEIQGFFPDDLYDEDRANLVTAAFNARYNNPRDEFSPIMGTLRTQSGLADYLDLADVYSTIIISIFVTAMSVVLWNTGLTGSLRRYGEIGVRLAIGEDKGSVYRSMMAESLMIGFAGSFLGTVVGLAVALYLQVHGLDYGSILKGSSLMMSNTIRSQITPFSFVIGFLPGMLATFLGTAISGIGIYKRQTSQLFKELEA